MSRFATRSAILSSGQQGMVGQQAIRIFLGGRCRRTFLLASLLIAAAFMAAVPARAQFAVCNQTLDALNLAIAKVGPDRVTVSEGWWTIGANRCVDVIKDELANKYIYVYATDVFGQPILAGDFDGDEMCIAPKRFTIEGEDSCWQRGYMSVRFMVVDTKDQPRWTLYLKEPYSG